MTDVLAAMKLHLIPRSQSVRRYAQIVVVVLVLFGLEHVGPLAGNGQGQPTWVKVTAMPGSFIVLHYVLMATRGYSNAIGLGLTRSAFCLGALLLAVAESLGFGIVLTALETAQRTAGLISEGIPVTGQATKVIGYAGPLLMSAVIGLLAGTLFQRWGRAAALGWIGLGLVWLSWLTTRQALAEAHYLALMVAWPLLAAVAVAAAWYPLLRRTDA